MRSQFVLMSLLGLAAGCGGDANPQKSPQSVGDAAPTEDAAAHELEGGQTGEDAGARPDAAEPGECSDAGGCGHDGAVGCEPSGLELCDGMDNDCDPSTLDGADEPGMGEPCDGEDTDACAEGVLICSSGGPACGDVSADDLDACDGVDNDCDGTVDQACAEASFAILDFDVAGDGSAVAIGAQDNHVRMMCFGPDGSIVRDAFDAGGPEVDTHALVTMEVARSRGAGNVALAFTYRPTVSDWRNFVAFFDSECQLVAAPQPLDAELANTGLNRRLGVLVADDGTSYVLYEHDTAKQFRVLVFDAQGQRSADVTLNRPSECAGDGRPGKLVLDAKSGDFGVFCEGGSTRNFRRFSADGSPLDAAIRGVTDSTPDGFSFHYWSAAMNRAGEFLYFGRNAESQWLIQPYDALGTALDPTTIQGSVGVGSPRVAETSRGDFLVELGGPDYQLALLSPAGSVLQDWAESPGPYRLDAQDHVYVVDGRTIVRSGAVSLP